MMFVWAWVSGGPEIGDDAGESLFPCSPGRFGVYSNATPTQYRMAAPPSPGGAVAEQERLVALIPVLSRNPFLSNLLRRSLADRDSLGLSLEGCEPIGLWPASSEPSRLAFVSLSLLLPGSFRGSVEVQGADATAHMSDLFPGRASRLG
jgi:hypothetical protein